MDLALDTSILRRDPHRRSAAFQAVNQLAREGTLRIHLSQVVVEEFVSSQVAARKGNLEKFRSAANKLRREGFADPLGAYYQAIVDGHDEKAIAVENAERTRFSEWLDEVGATVHDVKAEHGSAVVEDYFAGEGAFSKPKERDDFPDSFVMHSAADLADECDDLVAVCADNGLSEALGQKGIKVYASLDEFVGDAQFRELLAEHHSEANSAGVIDWFSRNPSPLTNFVENNYFDLLPGQWVASDAIPGENNEGMIVGGGTVDSVSFDFDSSNYVGRGLIEVPYSAELDDIEISFSIFKGDYWALPDELTECLHIEELNDHFFDAEAVFSISIEGKLAIKVDADVLEAEAIDGEAAEQLAESAEITWDEVGSISVPYHLH